MGRGSERLKIALPDRRLDWDEMWVAMALVASGRAECVRRRVGALIVRDNRVVGSPSYNGARSGALSCLQGACPRGLSDAPAYSSYDSGPGACIAIHAEQNAIMSAPPEARQGATIYVTAEPCVGCRRMIEGSGVSRIVWLAEDGERRSERLDALPER